MESVADNSHTWDIFDRESFTAFQAEKRSKLVPNEELENLLEIPPETLGQNLRADPTRKNLARLVNSYLENHEIIRVKDLFEFAGFGNNKDLYESFRRILGFEGKPRFKGQILGSVLNEIGATDSNIIEAMNIYPELTPGAVSIQRDMSIPEINDDVAWLAGILSDANFPLGHNKTHNYIRLPFDHRRVNITQDQIKPLADRLFNYESKIRIRKKRQGIGFRTDFEDNCLNIDSNTIVSYFLDVIGIDPKKENRDLSFNSYINDDLRKKLIGGIIDWYSTEVELAEDKRGKELRFYPTVELWFPKDQKNLADAIAVELGYKKARVVDSKYYVHLGTGYALLERINKYKPRSPKFQDVKTWANCRLLFDDNPRYSKLRNKK